MNNKNTSYKEHSLVLSSIVCVLASLFYLYEFILQVSPAVMTNELMKAFSIGAIGVGSISASYYYSYTIMQLPAGILYDRFGPRVLLTFAVLICAFGGIFFGMTHNIVMASYGRFLMGIGSAFSFTGVLVLLSRWFPHRYFAVLAGIVQFMSSLGAIFGEVPLAASISKFGWQMSIIYLALFGIVLAAVMWFVVRDYPPWCLHKENESSKGQTAKGLREVLASRQTWFTGFYAFLVWAPIAVFAVLWGVPYIAAYYHVSTAVASSVISMAWVGIGLGSPFIGWLSDFIGRRCLPLIIVSVIGFISTICILYVPNVPFVVMYVLLFFLGVAASGQSLSFGLIRDNNNTRTVGTAVGFNNMSVVAGGALLQPLVGFLIHNNWAGGMLHGVPVYTVFDYRNSLWILPICYVLSFTMSCFFLKESNCKPQTKGSSISL